MSEQDQLGAIDSLGGALDRRGVEHWLFGGWAVDFVEADGEGRVVVPIPGQPVVWAPEPFGNIRRTLLGVSCRILPLPLLRDGKASPRPEAAEGAKDRADFAALSTVDLYEM